MRRTAVLAVCLTAAALPVAAQGLRKHDTNAPVDVDADRVEWRNADRQATFTGNVVAKQGDLTMTSASMRVATKPLGDKVKITRLDALGNVTLTSPDERATSRSAIYDVEAKLITMVDNVVLYQGQSVLKGQRLVVNLTSGQSSLDPGAAPGGGRGRVSGRFVVEDRKDSGTSKQ
jgi:lipopolysaccharide export system protein LptA